MKATLKEITTEMTGTTELTEVIKDNFDALNIHGHKREKAILGYIQAVEARIERRFDALFNYWGIPYIPDQRVAENDEGDQQ